MYSRAAIAAKDLPVHDETPALPALANAQLPASYQAAQKALAECSRVDECKDWSDKARALASYARQAKDSTLHNLALRIQSRAQRRMGELLKLVPRGDADGANLAQNRQAGALPPVTRTQVARDAGLSEHQRKTALRIANVPEPDFEAAVESDKPPTVTEMAMRGTATRELARVPDPGPDLSPADPALVARAHRWLREFAAFCGAHDPVGIALSCGDGDMLRGHVETIDGWLDRFITRLPAQAEGPAAA
jgi:hypothetical protein